MFKKIGHRVVCFDATNEGGGGGTGGDAHPVAPWHGVDGPWTVGEGDKAQPWFSFVPEDAARETVKTKGYKNPAELALAYHNLMKLQRNDPTVIGLPGENATPDDWNAFYNRLGRPEAPDKYEFNFGEGVKPDDGMMNFARTAFHEVGLNGKQAQDLADKWNKFAAEQNTAIAAEADKRNGEELAALTSRWGADLEANKAAGLRVVQSLGLSPEFINRIEGSVGAAPLVELLAMIGKKSGESGGFVTGGSNGDPNDPSTMNSAQAMAKINELRSDPVFAARLTNATDPGHRDAVQKLERLYARV